MKKIFVLSVFLVVIGVLCAVFLLRDDKKPDATDEKPWTVGEQTGTAAAEETTEPRTPDTVDAFFDLVHVTLREQYTFLSKQAEQPYTAADLTDALLGMYIYDLDTDGEQELALVRSQSDGVFLDIYECRGGKAQFAVSQKLILDTMSDVAFTLSDSALRHLEARMTIFPKGPDRFFCLTVEQQGMDGEYDAYTVVFEYAKEKLTLKKIFRLRQSLDVVTFMCLDNATLLYRQAAGQAAAEDTGVTLAKYSDLALAFKTEFGALGLTAPQVTAANGELTQYKVMPVASEQHVFETVLDAGSLQMTDNGFLQDFVIRH